MTHNNLWAPWRIEYLKSLSDANHSTEEGCFLCRYWQQPKRDKDNLVLWRTDRCMTLFNRFPYTGGHLLIAPSGHIGTMDQIDNETMMEILFLVRDAQQVLTEAIHPHGFNVGININRCAGAGLPGHLHVHVVPRWDGDTNFMGVTGGVRVISQALEDLYEQLQELSGTLNLPHPIA